MKKPFDRIIVPKFILFFFLLVTSPPIYSVEIIKSKNDNRTYQYFTLENGVRGVAVQDPDATSSAVSVNVGVGSLQNPKEVSGLAHFLEHLLFLGTKKYPEADSFNEFLNQNGGSSNAFTASEQTNYFIQVTSKKLPEAIDRFSQFFIAPLFDKKWVDRELNAVEAEHSKNIRSDAHRFYSVMKEQRNPDHPVSFFSTGNKETLNIPDNREKVIEFYNRFYSADIMTVAIVDERPVEDIVNLAKSVFAAIPRRDVKIPLYKGRYLKEGVDLPYRLNIKTIRQQEKLTMLVPLPPSGDDKQGELDSMQYITSLIGCEQEGCPAWLLKKEGFITGLFSGGGQGDDYSRFVRIDMSLTELGKKNIGKINGLLFQYFDLIKKTKPEKWRFDEYVITNRYQFDHQQKEDPTQAAIAIATRLEIVEPENILTYGYLPKKFNPDKIIALSEYLRKDNFFVVYQSDKVVGDQTEKWYGTEYSLELLDTGTVKKWNKAGAEIAGSSLTLPEGNEYITTNESLLKDETAQANPMKLIDSDKEELWYKNDVSFNNPSVIANINFFTPVPALGPVRKFKTGILVRYWNDEILQQLYSAITAGYSISIKQTNEGVRLKITGNAEKITRLAQETMKIIRNSFPSEEKFNIYKKDIDKGLQNWSEQDPLSQIFSHYNYLNINSSWQNETLLKAFEQLEFKGMEEFASEFFSTSRIKSVIYGNTDKKLAQELHAIMATGIDTRGYTEDERHAESYLLHTAGKRERHVFQVKHKDSGYGAVFQSDDRSIRRGLELFFFERLLSDKFFYNLRTEKQLGYIVQSFKISSNRNNRYAFVVQSPVAEPDELSKHLDDFLVEAHQIIKAITPEQIDEIKNIIIKNLNTPPINLSEAYVKYFQAIYDEDFEFQLNNIPLEQLKLVTKESIVSAFEEMFISSDRRLFEFMAFSTNSNGVPVTEGDVGDLVKMKKRYPRIGFLPVTK
mgnify:CR=1 FL=1